ncbi:MAG: AAA family ATPase [Pseudomonadota bacterium]
MEIALPLLFGALLGAAMTLLVSRLLAAKADEPASTQPDEQPSTPDGEHTTKPETPSFNAAALHKLAEDLEPRADELARPNDLLEDEDFRKAVALLRDGAVSVETLVEYAGGANWLVACAALEVLRTHAEGAKALDDMPDVLQGMGAWPMYFGSRYVQAHAPERAIGLVFARVRSWWTDNVRMHALLNGMLRELDAAGVPCTFGSELPRIPRKRLEKLRELLKQLSNPAVSTLAVEVDEALASTVDVDFLTTIGRVRRPGPTLPAEAPPIADPRSAKYLEMVSARLQRDPPASVVLVGDTAVGKSAVRELLASALIADGWTVVEFTANRLVADKSYIGQIEGVVQRVVEKATVRARVALFVDRMHELSSAGTYRNHPQGVLDALLPALEQGTVFLVGETGTRAWQQLLKQRPALPTALEALMVDPATDRETTALVSAYLNSLPSMRDSGDGAVAQLTGEAIALARSYISHLKLPGAAMELVKMAVERDRRRATDNTAAKPLGRQDLLATLGEVSGLPEALLDEQQRLDIDAIAHGFAERIIGQQEAIDCLVERIAMIKAGLTDAGRPAGVFLFAGPTGTGKTEIAKTLAELLFGNVDRMIRLDMSEYRGGEAPAKLLGARYETGQQQSLVDQVRRQPFSVILLDEFEKADRTVWDLFLQVFDDGRLTDAVGNVADFRHCIIILTSNVGATISSNAGIGFTGEDAGGFDPRDVRTAIGNTFRKEFVNRLDRVVVFQPFTRPQMRRILQRELHDVLQRRGLRNREWAVEWEDSAVDFLLAKGFSPDLGARPLRRAIDHYVLAPLSMTIVRQQFPEGDQFLFVRGDQHGIRVEFVDPDLPDIAKSPPAAASLESAGSASADLSLGQVMLDGTGNAAERAYLSAQIATLAQTLEGERWESQKSALLARINEPAFWESPERHQSLSRMELMDRLESGWRALHSLLQRRTNGAASARLHADIAQKLHLLGAALEDLNGERPIHAFIAVSAGEAGQALATDPEHCYAAVCRMYEQWASHRRMKYEVLEPRAETGSAREQHAAVSGFGAYSLLRGESGLHVWEIPLQERRTRLVVRVTVTPQPVAPAPSRAAWLESARQLLSDASAKPMDIVRRYREQPSPLVRDARGWRTGRLDRVLDGHFDIM